MSEHVPLPPPNSVPKASALFTLALSRPSERNVYAKLSRVTDRGTIHVAGEWRWTGGGIPTDLLTDLLTRVHATLTEFIITTYGEQLTMFDHEGRKLENHNFSNRSEHVKSSGWIPLPSEGPTA